MFCPHCGKEIVEGQVFCQYCGSRLIDEQGVPSPATGRSKTDWENREQTGFFIGFFRTIKEILSAPADFFKKMPLSGGLTDPLLFALMVGMAGLMSHYFWDTVLYNSMQDFMASEIGTASGRSIIQGFHSPLAALLTPFMLIFWLFAISGALHLFLHLIRGAGAGFEATFRAVSYSMSPFVFLIIPFCGMPISGLWVMILVIIGLKEAHTISGGKAAFAVLFPFIFCCGLLILAIALFMGAVVASFGSLLHR